MNIIRIAILAAVLTILAPSLAMADSSVTIPAPCGGTMSAQTPRDDGVGNILAVSIVNCSGSVTDQYHKVELYYYYTSTSEWKRVNLNDHLFSGIASALSTACPFTDDGTYHSWKARGYYGGGIEVTSVVTLRAKKAVC